jgi:serine/threonine protein kinase
MRFVRGDSLKDAIAAFHADPSLRSDSGKRSLALRKLLRRFVDVCNAVEYAHSRGVLHRDLKPGNVMVLAGAPKIIDFGIAQPATAEQHTQAGVLTGTPGYVAPELIDGGRSSEAADVFSWAATVAFAATGRPPFGAGSLHGVCFRVLRGAADLDGVPEPVLSLVRQALHRDPAARPSAAWLAVRLTLAESGRASPRCPD